MPLFLLILQREYVNEVTLIGKYTLVGKLRWGRSQVFAANFSPYTVHITGQEQKAEIIRYYSCGMIQYFALLLIYLRQIYLKYMTRRFLTYVLKRPKEFQIWTRDDDLKLKLLHSKHGGGGGYGMLETSCIVGSITTSHIGDWDSISHSIQSCLVPCLYLYTRCR